MRLWYTSNFVLAFIYFHRCCTHLCYPLSSSFLYLIAEVEKEMYYICRICLIVCGITCRGWSWTCTWFMLFNEFVLFPLSLNIGGDVICSVDLYVFFTSLTLLNLNRNFLFLFLGDLVFVLFFGRKSLANYLEWSSLEVRLSFSS